MANIMNIETSAADCTVSISVDGETRELWEDLGGSRHSRVLAPFVGRALEWLDKREAPLDAVAVSLGPGSYTGLRIGLSMAKGVAFARNIPLIGLPTLEILAVKAMFSRSDLEGDELVVPMVDARRMEVYAGVYDLGLNALMEPRPVVLEADSFGEFAGKGKRLLFIGDGSVKARGLLSAGNALWLSGSCPNASTMGIMAEKAFREGRFIDTAYSTPLYLKDYEARKSVNRVLRQAHGD